MKIVFVVDSISDINNKINLFKSRFGDSLYFVVRADLAQLFQTYNYSASAIYYKNLSEVVQSMLLRTDLEDIVIYRSSLNINNDLMNKFISAIGKKDKVVNIMPQYNTFEQICNSAYNVYVNSLFKMKDCLASTKLQYIPETILGELLLTHIGNRLFEIGTEYSRNVYIENKETNESLKTKTFSWKYNIIAIIIALCVTMGLLASIAYYKVSYIIVVTCIVLYCLDIILTIIFQCKAKFDKRFFK